MFFLQHFAALFPSALPYFILAGAKKSTRASGWVLLKRFNYTRKKKPAAYSREWKVDRLARAVTDIYFNFFPLATSALGRMIRVISRSRAFCSVAGINKTSVTLRRLIKLPVGVSSHVLFFSLLSATLAAAIARRKKASFSCYGVLI